MEIFTEKALSAGMVTEEEFKKVLLCDVTDDSYMNISEQMETLSSEFNEELKYYTFFTDTTPLTPHQNYIVDLYYTLVSQGLISTVITNINKMEEEINNLIIPKVKKDEFINDYSSEEKIFESNTNDSLATSSPLSSSSFNFAPMELESKFTDGSETVSSYGPIREKPKNFCVAEPQPIKMYLLKRRHPKKTNKQKQFLPDDLSYVSISVFPYVKFYSRSLRGADELNRGDVKLKTNGFILWVERAFENAKYRLTNVSRKKHNTLLVRTHYLYQTSRVEKDLNVDIEFHFSFRPVWKENKLGDYTEKLGRITDVLQFISPKVCYLKRVKLVGRSGENVDSIEFVLDIAKIKANIACLSILYSLYQFCEKNNTSTKSLNHTHKICYARAILTAFDILTFSSQL